MKYLLITLSLLTVNSYAKEVELKCYDAGLKAVMAEYEYSSREDFYKENELIFSCKSRAGKDTELLQWGDGRGLVGVSFEIKNGKCVMIEAPYSGQDDGDLDIEWAIESCQEFEDVSLEDYL